MPGRVVHGLDFPHFSCPAQFLVTCLRILTPMHKEPILEVMEISHSSVLVQYKNSICYLLIRPMQATS